MENKQKMIVLAVFLIAIAMAIVMLEGRKVNEGNTEERNIVLMQDSERAKEKAKIYDSAKELQGISGYLNIGNITINENIGKKVVLLDFWTYSCINCQRTLPYLNEWWSKYKDKGLVIIGVHTPEFEFEKDYENVKKAVEKYNVRYPVVQDNEYATWQAYRNRYWPRKYLIDIDGFIVYDHIGEGSYDETEVKIQQALEERNSLLKINNAIDKSISKPEIGDTDFSSIRTQEVYFGLLFSRKQFGNPEGWQAGKVIKYSYPRVIDKNLFYLDGSWKTNPDNMELIGGNGGIKIIYDSKDVNLVAGSPVPVEIIVYVDGEQHKNVIVRDFDLYNVVSLKDYGQHELEIKINKPGLMAYTFTFG